VKTQLLGGGIVVDKKSVREVRNALLENEAEVMEALTLADALASRLAKIDNWVVRAGVFEAVVERIAEQIRLPAPVIAGALETSKLLILLSTAREVEEYARELLRELGFGHEES